MSLCASCGLNNPNDVGLCPHHHAIQGSDDWAVSNRIMCDFLHRQRAPRRLTEVEHNESFVAGSILVQITRPSEA